MLLIILLLSGCNSINNNKSVNIKTNIKTNDALSCKEEIIENSYYLVFLLDGKHLIYVAKEGGKYMVVKDGIEGNKYDKIAYLVYSPDGKHFSYIAKEDEKKFVVKETCGK